MFDRFKKKNNLTVSNFLTAADGRVIARAGALINNQLLNELRNANSAGKARVRLTDTLIKTHFKNLLAEPKYEFILKSEVGGRLLFDIINSVEITELTLKEFMWMQRYDYQYHHSFAVAALTATMSYMFYRDKQKAVQVASCALTHDFGITRIPEHILYKQGSLDTDELKLMREHPVYSYLMLIYYGLDEPALNARVSFEHHENLIRTGYPRGIKPEYEITQFIQISDIFDALITARPFRAAKTVEQALAIVSSMAEEGKLDREFVAVLQTLFTS